MSKRKKQAKVLKSILAAALILLALELGWLFFALFDSGKPADSDIRETGETVAREQQEQQEQQETTAAESNETDEQSDMPWKEPGAKQPADYTWEEFEALTGAQQIAFQNYLGFEGFAEWMNRAQQPTQPPEMPWDVPGAKRPADYSWAEYEALPAAQQMAFQTVLGAEGFEKWLNRVQNQPEKNPWDAPGAKRPEDYTWTDFEALTAAQQIAFQDYLGAEGFAVWLEWARAADQSGKNPWDVPGAKQPADYTWEEFEALTAAQQIAFQNCLGEAEFDAWLNRVQNQTEVNPWEVPGAKRPEDYTWEEFEALTAAQQIAFQNYLGEAAFEAWLNRVLG